jgi:hypothetical protein
MPPVIDEYLFLKNHYNGKTKPLSTKKMDTAEVPETMMPKGEFLKIISHPGISFEPPASF